MDSAGKSNNQLRQSFQAETGFLARLAIIWYEKPIGRIMQEELPFLYIARSVLDQQTSGRTVPMITLKFKGLLYARGRFILRYLDFLLEGQNRIILEDLNAHHDSWFSELECDCRGKHVCRSNRRDSILYHKRGTPDTYHCKLSQVARCHFYKH